MRNRPWRWSARSPSAGSDTLASAEEGYPRPITEKAPTITVGAFFGVGQGSLEM